MSHPKPRKPRPLGSLRHISKTSPEKLPTIPKLLPEINPDTEKLKEGIHGNAMAVPPPAESGKDTSRHSVEDRPKSDKVSTRPPKSSGSSGGSVVSHEHCEKEIKDGLVREKQLKDQLVTLIAQVAELRAALTGKEAEILQLRQDMDTQEKNLRGELKDEQTGHDTTKVTLTEVKEELGQAHQQIGQMVHDHEARMEKMKLQLEQRLTDLESEKDSAIQDREQKLSRLKAQMAEALKGNSWERQQQLEELTKELSRLQEESDLLRMRIKSMGKSKQSPCTQCEENRQKVSRLEAAIKEKDSSIRELKTLCGKFEHQLSTQDKLLEQWAHSKGHKISAPK